MKEDIADTITQFLERHEGMTLQRFAQLYDRTGRTTATSVWRWAHRKVTPSTSTQRLLVQFMKRKDREARRAS